MAHRQVVQPRPQELVRDIRWNRCLLVLRDLVELPSRGSANAMTGEPATIRSTPARASRVASSVLQRPGAGPIPSAMASAMAAVFPR